MVADIDIPFSWENSAETILKNRLRKILVIGAADRGKSTYCNFLVHALMSAGSSVAFVDADIGQKDVGPPTTISLGYPEPGLQLCEIQPSALYFAGSVSPAGHFLPAVVGTRRLVDAARAPHVVIDTTGLIHGIGIVLKAYQIESLRPDVIVAIEKGHELRSVLNAYRNHRTIRIGPSARAVPKTPEQRRAARRRAFKDYFKNSRTATLKTREVVFQRTLLFNGKPLTDPRFIHLEQTSEGILAVSDNRAEAGKGLKLLHSGFEENLLCGVADRHGDVLGLGIIRRIDFSRKTITLVTPVPADEIRIVQFGDIYLSPEGRELGMRRIKGF